MTRKTTIRLATIVPLLLVLAYGTWYGANWLCAGQLNCCDLLTLGDVETAKWCLRYRPGKANDEGTVDPSNSNPHYYLLQQCGRSAWALGLSSYAEDGELMKLLLNEEAGLGAQGNFGWTLVDAARHCEEWDFLARCRRYGCPSNSDRDLSHYAAAKG